MAYLNKVFLVGNLTRDPEVRYIPSGKAVADLGIAVNRRYKSATGEEREDTCFVNVIVWGRQAELAGEYLKKGSSILVEGSLRMEQWESSNGEKRSRLVVTAERIQFLDRQVTGKKRADIEEVADDTKIGEDSEVIESRRDEVEDDPDNLPF